MYHIMIGFQSTSGSLEGNRVTARGLHGCLYDVLKRFDSRQASWLHGHTSPKPYSLAPYYSSDGSLLGLRLAAITDEAAETIISGWQRVQVKGDTLRLGPQTFFVRAVEYVPGPTFVELASNAAAQQITLRFLSPTAFRQGPGALPLPVPGNVFGWPKQVWDAYAPSALTLPPDWIEWCQKDVYVTQHRIETVDIALDKRVSFTGFVGEVEFSAQADNVTYLHVWEALAGLATFCGVGHKTTMGMGAVERIG